MKPSIASFSPPRGVLRILLPHRPLHLSRLTVLGAMIAIGLTPASRAEDVTARPLRVSLHVDLLGDRAVDGVPNADVPTAKPIEYSLIGLPVTFGERKDPDDARIGLEAGVRADYTAKVGNHLSLTATAGLAKAGYMDNGWGTDRASAVARLRLEHDGWALALEPAWRLDIVETIVTRSDYATTLRLAKTLPQGFGVSGGLRYGRHDALASADDNTAATAFATLSYRLGEGTTLDLTYDTAYKLQDDGKVGTFSFGDLHYAANTYGPTLAVTFAAWETLDISAIYRYCRSTDDLPRHASSTDRRADDIQIIDLTASWHSNDPAYSGINLTAAYGYDRMNSTAAGANEVGHTATIAFAMPF